MSILAASFFDSLDASFRSAVSEDPLNPSESSLAHQLFQRSSKRNEKITGEGVYI